MQADSDMAVSLSTSADSTDRRFSGIDSCHMKRAVLYARVSSDLQAKEGTIES
jgi:hypothetical protein